MNLQEESDKLLKIAQSAETAWNIVRSNLNKDEKNRIDVERLIRDAKQGILELLVPCNIFVVYVDRTNSDGNVAQSFCATESYANELSTMQHDMSDNVITSVKRETLE